MDAKEILRLFDKAVSFSQKNKTQRLIERPLFTTSRSLPLKIYHLLGAKKSFGIHSTTFWGEPIYLTIPDGVSVFKWGFISGDEIELTKFLIRNLRPGDIFVDGGAHYGFYSLLASILVGPAGSVHSFEPTPSTFAILARNVEKKKNIVINQKALWRGEEVLSFTDFGTRFRSYNTIMPETLLEEVNKSPEKKTIRVQATTLDRYREEAKMIPSLVKLDVESAELFAIQGMSATLKKHAPVLSVEFWGGTNWRDTHEQIFAFLRAFKYSPYKIENGELVPYQGEKDFSSLYTNLIFRA